MVPFRLIAAALIVSAVWLAGGAAASTQQPTAKASSCAIETTERVVAVGDIHGAFDRFVAILREAQLIDARRRWIGGRAILVQTGDVLDRGPDSRKALDLLRQLSGEAEKAGGRVYPLLGNHEAMRIIRDLRMVSAGEYAAFRSPDSQDLLDAFYDRALTEMRARARTAEQAFNEREFRKQFLEETPLGSVEMLIAFSEEGEYGRWLRERDAMIKINGFVFVHGGISAAMAKVGCESINTTIRAELRKAKLTDPDLDKMLIAAPDGPLWYRDLVDGTPDISAAQVDAILKTLDARAMVVAHTQAPDMRIHSRFDGRVFQIDTGMVGGEFYPGGQASALEIRGGTITAIYVGRREVLVPAGRPQG